MPFVNGRESDGHVEYFDRREEAYLGWVQVHPYGWVANVDRDGRVPHYPMIHRASHGAISSARIGSFTTGDYVKFCALDSEELECELVARYGRRATHCSQCM